MGYMVSHLLEEEKNNNEQEILNWKIRIRDFILMCKNTLGEEDFYLEVAPSNRKEQTSYNDRLVSIARGLHCKMVIGTDAHYLTKKDRVIHKAYLNSKEGNREVDAFYSSTYLMDYEEILEYFCAQGWDEDFIQSICDNSIEIMNKIKGYSIKKKSIIPTVQVPSYNSEILDDKFKGQFPIFESLLSSNNMQERYWSIECLRALQEKNLYNSKYLDRLETEAKVISHIGEVLETCLFAYFNTFKHYIDLFWECGSIVGPGRGSAVCFLSNYLLGITQLDPIKWDIAYWRFLNMERVELPDIDIDLSPSKRPEIFKRIRKEIGETHLLQVCNFSTEQTRRAIQTACRGYRSEEYPQGIDSDIAQYMSGMIPQERGFLWPLSDVLNGNEEKDRKPIRQFIDEVNKYPGLLDIMVSIEGLVNNRGQHASGVILYNDDPTETNAIMRSPSGDLTTQFSLHESEELGDVKYDFLLTEVCDKIVTAIKLLQNDNEIEQEYTIRQVYNKYLHPESINLNDQRIWDALSNGEVMDVFQFNSDVGLAAAKLVKPQNPLEMMSANALLRLMAEKGHERPLDRYVRMKYNIQDWYKEAEEWGLSGEQIALLEKYYLPRYAVPAMQEDLMLVVMDECISHFSLKEANDARKIVAKKQMARIPELKGKFLSQCPDKNLGEYVWETCMLPQMG